MVPRYDWPRRSPASPFHRAFRTTNTSNPRTSQGLLDAAAKSRNKELLQRAYGAVVRFTRPLARRVRSEPLGRALPPRGSPHRVFAMPEALAYHECPSCSATQIERVPRRTVLDDMARLLGWRVYRCLECGTRFYDRPLYRKVE